MERLTNTGTVAQEYAKLLKYEPKLITNFVPTNAAEQKAAFLSGEVENPDHVYAKLAKLDFMSLEDSILTAGQRIQDLPELNPKHGGSYEQFVEGYVKKTLLMKLAHDYKTAANEDEKQRARDAYMALNIELYGEPDVQTFRSLLSEKVNKIATKDLTGKAEQVRDELLRALPVEITNGSSERFKPSEETMEWMHVAVETLYGGMLMHVPETQETLSTEEIKFVFESILRDEFGESAEGWKVDIEPAQSINVKSAEKRIVIPDSRGNVSCEQLRRLVVHEIGVHVLRAITGGSSDLEPLKNGLNDYYNSEEGLGKVMEHALDGVYVEAGIDHYITAGLAHVENMDFRKTFECKWRLSALSKLKPGDELTDEAIQTARESAYGATMRIFRGTDELPWFKDLAYYNGTVDMWRHLEEIKGDDIKFMFVLLGKANPASMSHQRIMLETKTV